MLFKKASTDASLSPLSSSKKPQSKLLALFIVFLIFFDLALSQVSSASTPSRRRKLIQNQKEADQLIDSLQTGLLATYFNTTTLLIDYDQKNGPPIVNRIDQNIDFTWNGKSPADSISGTLFSVLWLGQVNKSTTINISPPFFFPLFIS